MLKRYKVDVGDIALGMYIAELDRPWLESPFLLQGFLLKRERDLDWLRDNCQFVYVDRRKSVGLLPEDRTPATGARKRTRHRPFVAERPRMTRQELFPGRKLTRYTTSVTWKDEVPTARLAISGLTDCLKELFTRHEKSGAVEPLKIKRAVEPMVDSVMRNPDACLWLARMKQTDNYIYEHSVAVSIWAVALGRQLGLPKADLRTLAFGALLLDVGKLQVDATLLHYPGALTDEQFREMQEHVAHSVTELQNSGLMNKEVMSMVEHHHERHDGSGYPLGLSGNKIPVFARMAGIIDSYDAMTSHRPHASAMSSAEAIKELYDNKDIKYQAELVEEFIQAIGLYPAGTLVELSTGEVAIVTAESNTRRLRPQVMVLLDANKQPVRKMQTFNLMEETHNKDGAPLHITGALEPHAYGIDMGAIAL